jgi:hypothetical protein
MPRAKGLGDFLLKVDCNFRNAVEATKGTEHTTVTFVSTCHVFVALLRVLTLMLKVVNHLSFKTLLHGRLVQSSL